MKFKVKMMLFAVASGAFALATGSCVLRFLGDLLGDFAAFTINPN